MTSPPRLRRLWMTYKITTLYTAAVATYIAAGLTYGWFR